MKSNKKMVKSFSYNEVYEASLDYFKGDELAAKVFVDKYALRDNQGSYHELTPFDMHKRLAKEFARVEGKYENPMSEDEIFSLLENFRYIVPQGSPMSSVGNPFQLQSSGNCFVIESTYDSYGGILKTDQELAQLMKRRAGVGVNISNIRPKGVPTNNAARTTDGIGIFMERFSNTCREVAQGGRRGALILVISCHHPEIEKFIDIKKDLKKVTGANISILLSDEFMNAVKSENDVQLRWPIDDKKSPQVERWVSAKELWSKIVDAAHGMAEPGLLFEDNIKNNSIPHLYRHKDPAFAERATNPCFHGDERFLDESGYVKFKDSQIKGQGIPLVDNRISYVGDPKNEDPTNWKMDFNQKGTTCSEYEGGAFITQKSAELLELELSNGQNLKCTPDHHIATTDGMVEAKDLSPSHEILISVPTPPKHDILDGLSSDMTNDEMCSFLMGLIAGDGTFSDNKVHIDLWGDHRYEMTHLINDIANNLFKNNSVQLTNGWNKRKLSSCYISTDERRNKTRISSTFLKHLLEQKYNFSKETKLSVPEFVLNNARKKEGLFYLSGLYYADGSVQSGSRSNASIRLAQSNRGLLRDVQLLLHANGISSSIYLRRKSHTANIKNINYKVKDQYELITTCGGWKAFGKLIKFNHPQKDQKLKQLLSNVKRNYTKKTFLKLVSRKSIAPDTVYCIKESRTRSIIVNTVTTRRCGEIPMGTDSCRLLLLNVLSYVKKPFENKSSFDFDLFYEHAMKAQRLMDDLVDLEIEIIEKIIEKITLDPEPNEVKEIELKLWNEFLRVCSAGRRTGLGVTAIGDAVAALGHTYGSDKSIKVIEKIYKTMALAAHKSSCILAKERGPFEIFDYKLEDKSDCNYLKRIWNADPEIRSLAKKYGRRNIALTTTAPCGSVSILTQTTSGIEPAFLVKYTRRKKINPSDIDASVDFVDSMGDKWKEYTVYHHRFKQWMEITGKTEIEDSPYFKATSNDINWVSKVKGQAAAQRWVSHAISNTTNLPNNTTKEVVSDVYMTGYESGCKGVTVYRDGCRTGVLVSDETYKSQNKDKSKDGRPTAIIPSESPKRPKELMCAIHRATVKGVKWVVLVGMLYNELYEIFMGLHDNWKIPSKYTEGKVVRAKRGHYDLLDVTNNVLVENIIESADNEELSWTTRMISTSLRHGVPIEYLIEQLSKDGNIVDINNVLARLLKKHVRKKSQKKADVCPSCGSHQMAREDGCLRCLDCGFSGCG